MFQNVIKPSELAKTYRCPCCEFKTLHGRGHFELCEVCFWEDETSMMPTWSRGGPNGSLSLREAQANFREFGAMEKHFKSKVREAAS